MTLRVSGKHMDVGEAFTTRIVDRVNEAVGKYFDHGFSGQVTVTKSGSRFSADCTLHLDSGATLQSTGEAQDPQLAFEAAADKIETRLRRYKRRLKSRPATQPDAIYDDVAYRVMAPLPEEEEDLPADYAPTIVAESSVALRTMSVASAVVELDLIENPVLVFRNAGNDEVNIVYRRADGNIGWVDPSMVTRQAAPRA
ncbi:MULTISPECIES: ribosome-associated translation inhibitor RaiA [unclassified Ochrobactrum]|uniref:ribosome hibernation-promoting factor, HPF/YfiA family n=1 Tax=unclassified Ochrobactrum TaxID=239106 RepID=UPI000DEFE78B|nr:MULTISPECIES: ribosome-associated translation inhibitor RaiA [unclassified Ochrobactrum]MBQ0709235.1 ribosome-associated translation inhibitor RaiA [Ochrobactrum sp. AP1BH01-1]